MVSVACFGVRVTVMFHLMFVHYTFSSVLVAEWPPFGKLAICSHCLLSLRNLIYFPLWFLERDLAFDCASSCSLLFYYLLQYNCNGRTLFERWKHYKKTRKPQSYTDNFTNKISLCERLNTHKFFKIYKILIVILPKLPSVLI